MSRIDELLQELAPIGVPLVPMWKLTAWDKKFNAVDRTKQRSTRQYTYLLASELKELVVPDGGTVKLLGTGSDDFGWTTPEIAGDRLTTAEIVSIPWGGNPSVQYFNGSFVTADNRIAVVLDPTVLETKFLYYVMLSRLDEIRSFYRGAGIQHPSMQKVLDMMIPVPPVEVQREIVRTLDLFTSLEAELEAKLGAELEARCRQFSFYRDSLLSFDDSDCEWLTLSEVSLDFGRGKSKHRPRNDPSLYGGSYPFIQTGDVRNSGHLITQYSQTYNEAGLAQSKLWPRGTICITIAANIAETGILDFDACFPDSVIGMVVNPEKTSQHFVEYLLQSLKVNLAAKGQGSAQANINLATFENERFPFPSLEEQERIVGIVDKLDTFVNDLSSALRNEINARRQQYEYYRERLLTFEEAVA